MAQNQGIRARRVTPTAANRARKSVSKGTYDLCHFLKLRRVLFEPLKHVIPGT